jgi:hypothetical protein
VTKKRTIPVFDAEGRRLLTLPELAVALDITYPTARQRQRRGQLPEPAGWLDDRTALWHSPTDD